MKIIYKTIPYNPNILKPGDWITCNSFKSENAYQFMGVDLNNKVHINWDGNPKYLWMSIKHVKKVRYGLKEYKYKLKQDEN